MVIAVEVPQFLGGDLAVLQDVVNHRAGSLGRDLLAQSPDAGIDFVWHSQNLPQLDGKVEHACTNAAPAARDGSLSRWKTEAYDGLLEVFGNGAGGGAATRDTETLIERLYARIGELVVVFFRRVPRSRTSGEGEADPGGRRPAGVAQVRAGGRGPGPAVLRAEAGGRAHAGAAVGGGQGAEPGGGGGLADDPPGASDDEAAAGTPHLPVPAQGPGRDPARRGVVRRHHLHSGAWRVLLSGRGDGLGEPLRTVVGAGQHDGGGFLRERDGQALRHHGAPSISNTDQGSRRLLAVGRSPARRSCARCWTRG